MMRMIMKIKKKIMKKMIFKQIIIKLKVKCQILSFIIILKIDPFKRKQKIYIMILNIQILRKKKMKIQINKLQLIKMINMKMSLLVIVNRFQDKFQAVEFLDNSLWLTLIIKELLFPQILKMVLIMINLPKIKDIIQTKVLLIQEIVLVECLQRIKINFHLISYLLKLLEIQQLVLLIVII